MTYQNYNYGKRIPLTNDIPKLLQWKQNMEREYH